MLDTRPDLDRAALGFVLRQACNSIPNRIDDALEHGTAPEDLHCRFQRGVAGALAADPNNADFVVTITVTVSRGAGGDRG